MGVLNKLLIAIALTVFSSHLACQGREGINTTPNTSITINFKKEDDKSTFAFQRYDPYFLENYGIVAPPKHTVKEEPLRRVIRFHLDEPALLLLGFTEFFICPKDSLVIDYRVLKEDKNFFLDSIQIKHGIGIITLRSKRLFLLKDFSKELQTENDPNVIKQFIDKKSLQKATDISLIQLFKAYPTYKDSLGIKRYFEQYFQQYYFASLMDNIGKTFDNLTAESKKKIGHKINALAIDLDKESNIKTRFYWYGIRKAYKFTLEEEFKNELFEYSKIKTLISDYSPLTQQFQLLIAVKESQSVDNLQKRNNWASNLELLGNNIKNPDFITFFKKFKNSPSMEGQLDSAARFASLLNIAMKNTNLNEIFESTGEKYILMDFTGSWCAPCMEEIQKYILHKRLDTSKVVSPIWLFFENNSYDWLDVVKRFNLKSENCFLVKDREVFSKSFNHNFLWRGEFPHYFLFDRNMVLINQNAPAPSEFNPNTLKKHTVDSNPSSPPPPIKRRPSTQ